MRIVQLANFYTPTSGGLRTCLEETGRGYRAAGHDRVLIVPGKLDADEQTPSGRRIVLSSPPLIGSGTYRVITDRRRVLSLLADLRPDVLEVSDKLSVAHLARWARGNDVPIVLFSHERLDAILRPRVPRWLPLTAIADVVNRRLSRLVDEVIVASEFAAAEFARVGCATVRRVPLGVDLNTFRPVDQQPRGPGQTVGLVTLSRLSAEKRPELAVETLRVLHNSGLRAELTIIGDGPLRRSLQRRAAGLPVQLIGHVAEREVVARLVASADVALCPSPVETFGLATLEALACGTPVVVPVEGAARELVGGPGYGAVRDGTPESLADGVLALLSLPAGQRRAAARAAAQRYPWSATVARLLDGYAGASMAR
jgi:alpha-1,6-mannosyltransferase